MITLHYIKWEQNTFTRVVAVHLDWMVNNGNTFIKEYMWNCGSCSFIAIQIFPIWWKKILKLIFNFFQQVHSSVTIFFRILRFVLDELSDVLEECTTHVNAYDLELHPGKGSNICLVISKHSLIKEAHKQKGYPKEFFWKFTKLLIRNCEEIDQFILATLLRIILYVFFYLIVSQGHLVTC